MVVPSRTIPEGCAAQRPLRTAAHCGRDDAIVRAVGSVALLLSFLMLAGCAVQRGHDLPPLPDWDTRRDILAGLPEWEFKGRIGVSAGDEGFNGNLRWWQKGDLFAGTVSGPLGVGTVRIRGDDARVTVTDNEGAVTELENAEKELRAMYGED